VEELHRLIVASETGDSSDLVPHDFIADSVEGRPNVLSYVDILVHGGEEPKEVR
jgi:hypothetical protein